MEDIFKRSPAPFTGRDKSFSPSHTRIAHHKESKEYEDSFGGPETDTSSSGGSTDDEVTAANLHPRDRSNTVTSEEKKHLSSGSGTPISQSDPEWETEHEDTSIKTVSTKVPTPENPFNAHTPSPKRPRSKKQKPNSVVISKPTPIIDPMAMTANVASEAALQEARNQHKLLREKNHPEFSSNVFGSHNQISSVKLKHEAGSGAESDGSKAVKKDKADSKKRKRERDNKQDEDAIDGKVSKKSKKDRKKSSEEKSKTKDNYDIKVGSKEKDVVEEHSTKKKERAKQSKQKKAIEQPRQTDSSSGGSDNDSKSDRNTTLTNVGKDSKPSRTSILNTLAAKEKGKIKAKTTEPTSLTTSSSPANNTKTKSATPALSSSTTTTTSFTTPANLNAQETQLLNSIKTLLPETLLHSALNNIQQTAKKAHKAKANLNTPTSINDSTVILIAARDTLVLLAGKRLGISLVGVSCRGNADKFQNSAKTSTAAAAYSKNSQGLPQQQQQQQQQFVMGRPSFSHMEAELSRIVAEKGKEVERLEGENAILRELIGKKA